MLLYVRSENTDFGQKCPHEILAFVSAKISDVSAKIVGKRVRGKENEDRSYTSFEAGRGACPGLGAPSQR
jgi:hypothetical protein